jgi:hypothetical protein
MGETYVVLISPLLQAIYPSQKLLDLLLDVDEFRQVGKLSSPSSPGRRTCCQQQWQSAALSSQFCKKLDFNSGTSLQAYTGPCRDDAVSLPPALDTHAARQPAAPLPFFTQTHTSMHVE